MRKSDEFIIVACAVSALVVGLTGSASAQGQIILGTANNAFWACMGNDGCRQGLQRAPVPFYRGGPYSSGMMFRPNIYYGRGSNFGGGWAFRRGR